MTGFGLSESDKNSGNGHKSLIELFHAKGLDFETGFQRWKSSRNKPSDASQVFEVIVAEFPHEPVFFNLSPNNPG
jgi:hypothetical protein